MGGETKVIFTDIPEVSSLSYYLGMIDPTEQKDKSAPTDYQWQILKSRFFLWKNPELIAAPVAKRTSHIHIIISKDFAGVLPQRVKDQNLILSGPYPLNEYTYQECINYTLTFRMAPQWHKIENHFVYSNDFLSSEEPMEGIKFGLSILDGKLRMSATMQRVKLPLLNLENLGVNLERLQQTGRASINQTVYILPQLKKGNAVDISVKIPEECPFTTYSQLRRHWKNTHGYRLPYDEQGMLYVRVSFGWNNIPYSYPVVCTRPGKLHLLKSKNPDLVLSKFGEHMMKRCPTICGQEINIYVQEEDSFIPLADLISSKEEDEGAKKKNKSSGKATKSVSAHIEEPEALDDTQAIPFSLDKSIPSVKVPEPIQIVNVNTYNTPYRPSAFASTTSTPISSTSVLRRVPEFVPTLSPITKDPPIIYQVITTDRPIIKPLAEVNVLKRPQPVAPAQYLQSIGPGECLKLTGQVNIEPVAKKPAGGSEIENLARAKALYKINVPVLKNFCRENNIFFLTKDRKDALMQRIYDFYGVKDE